MDKLLEVKKKKEFSGLPDSLVERALEICSGDVKKTRAFLRKYFGVFLTNKILKEKFSGNNVLSIHKSSKERDYYFIYREIFEDFILPNNLKKKLKILDLGCGVNGFSYGFFFDAIGKDVKYVGVESVKQLVDLTNKYFEKESYDGKVVWGDLLDFDKIKSLVEKEKPDFVFLFNVIDALEKFERDYSKGLILMLKNFCEYIVISNPIKSLSGKSFGIKRKWLEKFLEDNFNIRKRFRHGFEEFLVLEKA